MKTHAKHEAHKSDMAVKEKIAHKDKHVDGKKDSKASHDKKKAK